MPLLTSPPFARSCGQAKNLIIFYGSVLGLGKQAVTAALSLSSLLINFIEPVIAYISDTLHTPWGRRHPLMAIAVLPMMMALVQLWDPPDKMTGDSGALFSYLLFYLVLSRGALSAFTVPADALVNELASEANERSRLVNAQVVLGWIGGTALPVIVARAYLLPSATGKDDGFFNEAGYRASGWLAAWVCAIAMVLSTVATAPHIPSLSGPPGRRRRGAKQGRGVCEIWSRIYEPLGIYNIKVCTPVASK